MKYLQVTREDKIIYLNGANDVDMLQEVDIGVGISSAESMPGIGIHLIIPIWAVLLPVLKKIYVLPIHNK